MDEDTAEGVFPIDSTSELVRGEQGEGRGDYAPSAETVITVHISMQVRTDDELGRDFARVSIREHRVRGEAVNHVPAIHRPPATIAGWVVHDVNGHALKVEKQGLP